MADNPLESQLPEFDISATQIIDAIVRRRMVVIVTFFIAIGAACTYVYNTIPVYAATSLLLIEKEERGSKDKDASLPESKTGDYYTTQYRLMKSKSMLKAVYEKLNLAEIEEFAGGINWLRGKIIISPVIRTRLVEITGESYDPELAAAISNAISETYVEQNLQNRLFISRDVLNTITRDFNEKDALGEEIQSLPAVVNNLLIQTLKGEAARLEIIWGDLSTRYTKDHPERKRLLSQRKAIQKLLRRETIRAVNGLKAELSGKLMGNNVRIVDHADVPGLPSRPDRTRIFMLASAAGLMLGFLIAVALENFDQTIHTQEDIERKLKLPFLGAVSKSEVLSGETAEELKNLLTGAASLTTESFKNIRTMIGLSAAGTSQKKILLTSTVQGEGKTFLSINLALVFAQLGEKVLLIEGDLRRPNLHKRFALSNELGLSHYLAHGSDVSELPALIQDTDLFGLKVLVCGHIPPNPSELLSTPRLKELLDWASREYDHVLIDGTPVFPITDALLWSQEADSSIFIVQFGGINASLAMKAKQKLLESGVKIAGAVINQVTWKGKSYYGDYYYHYHYYTRDGKEKNAEKA